ncbi:type II RES/Xre toxin-antitoxin system antitoxin [Nitratireductor mangrovi]|nr:antitoxin Xre/MbcA/ParS toxin-binding domain-containing protein [Nitratireductor mangrovi]
MIGRELMNTAFPVTASPGSFTVPVERLDGLRKLGFSDDELYRIIAPRRTLARRKAKGEVLSPVESDRVIRLERISEHGTRVFASAEKFRRWLRHESVALDGARPIDLMQSETGARLVEDELARIDHGMLA